MMQQASQNAASGATIDPVKLLNRYKWWLIGAAVVGAGLGGTAYFVTTRFFPRWRPIALFDCLPPQNEVGVVGSITSEGEILRFMQTQVRFMASDEVFKRVSEDPSLQTNAQSWCGQFQMTDSQTGLPAFDTQEAAKQLKKDVVARVIPTTTLIELSMTDRSKTDSTEILKLVREKYETLLREQTSGDMDDRVRSIRDSLTRYDNEMNGLAARREGLIRQTGVTSIDNQVDNTRIELTTVSDTLIRVSQDLDAARVRLSQLEAELENPGGIVFGDELKEEVERNPLILDLKADISRLESRQQALLNHGVTREHREFTQLEATIAGTKQNIDQSRTDLLRQAFDARVDGIRKLVAQYESQEKSLQSQKTTLTQRMTDLARTSANLNDISSQINALTTTKAQANSELQSLVSLTQVSAASRVILRQPERTPTQMAVPDWKVMVGGGLFATVAFVGAAALLRELIDQRIKGPADIAIIPRTRVVGWVPDASEDLAGQGAPETAFRDRPKGVLAESFRQMRSTVAKRMSASDHRTLLVIAGMPGSGATSTVANLAVAFATADKKVLMIDANFRRPALHRVFGLQESPGLGDILGKSRDFKESVQATSTPNLDLLTAGSKEHRVFERLATESLSEVLAQARAAYDIVILDVAPAIVAGDGVSLANRVDCSILVVKALAEKRGMVARFKNELAESKGEFLGVAVNAVQHAAGGYMKRNIKTAYEYHQS